MEQDRLRYQCENATDDVLMTVNTFKRMDGYYVASGDESGEGQKEYFQFQDQETGDQYTVLWSEIVRIY